MTWWPADAPATVKVRAQISDRAGNMTISNANAESPSQVARNDAGSKPTEPASSAPSQSWTSAPPPTSKPNSQWPTDHVASDPFGRAPINSATLPDGPVESTVSPPIRNQAPPATGTTPSRKPLGDDVAAPSRNTSPAGSNSNATLPAGERPRMVNARSFDLEYEVDGIGPYGIARVELWGTRDGGRTWTSYGADNDNRSPIRANVDGEGLYGFRITVQSGNGLQSQAPRSGDAPQIWVSVDLTKPVVRLTNVEAGTIEHAGELVIHWEASDAALATRPITLAFSDRAGGPWSIIAAGLENTGTYAWRPDNRAPDRIYSANRSPRRSRQHNDVRLDRADGTGADSARSAHSRSAPRRRRGLPHVDGQRR